MAVVSSSRNAPRGARRRRADAIGSTWWSTATSLAAERLPGKPAPDMFLLRRPIASVSIRRRAVVVEDAISGVAAGRDGAFGARGRRRPRRQPRGPAREHGADVVVDDLAELAGRAGRDARTAHRIALASLGAPLPDRSVAPHRARVRPRRHRARPRRCSPSATATSACAPTPRRAATLTTRARTSTASTRRGASTTPRTPSGSPRSARRSSTCPTARSMKLYVDDEPLRWPSPTSSRTSGQLDLRDGIARPRSGVAHARTASGCGCARSGWCRSPGRHLAVLRYDVTMLERRRRGGAAVAAAQPPGRGVARHRPARRRRRPSRARRSTPVELARRSATACCEPRLHTRRDDQVTLGFQCANSGMSIACAVRHHIDGAARPTGRRRGRPAARTASRSSTADVRAASRCASSSTSPTTRRRYVAAARRPRWSSTTSTSWRRGAPARSTASCTTGSSALVDEQRRWLERVLGGERRRDRRPTRGRCRRAGRPAGDALEPVPAGAGVGPDAASTASPPRASRRRLRGPLLLGHRDLRGAVPRLHEPRARRRELLRFRWRTLPHGPPAGRESSASAGALYPWRTINGEEASAYYAAGTAQYHINADDRLRPQALRRRQRRHRVPRQRGGRDPRRDGAAVGGPRLLRHRRPTRRRSTSTGSPGPTSTRRSSTTTCTRT